MNRTWRQSFPLFTSFRRQLGGKTPLERDVFDVCVVGSGFSGTYLALHLASRGVKTLLVEAGDTLPPGGSLDGQTDLFPYESNGSAGFPVDFNRTIGLGGTSHKWNGVLSRLLPRDFQSRSHYGLFCDWPITFEDLTSYYDAAEQTLGLRTVPLPEPFAPLFPPDFPFDDLRLEPLSFSGTPASGPVRIGQTEIARFLSTGSGSLLTRRPATRLHPDRHGSISRLELQGPDGKPEFVQARHFVLAAGVVETVRLLLASTSTAFPEGIGNGGGLLGRFVHAHPRPRLHFRRGGARAKLHGVFRSYHYCDEFRKLGLAAACVDLNFFEPDPTVDITLETEPAPQNRIRLHPDKKDAWGRPIAVLDYHPTPLDQRTREHADALHRKLVTALNAGDGPIRAAPEKCFHPAGGCRMGRNADEGVVNGDGLVFGTDNLHLAGASVFPVSGAGNPTLTLVALALRLGDHLSKRLNGHAS